MEEHKIKEALSLDIFLQSLLHLEDSKSDEESDDDMKGNIFISPATDKNIEQQPRAYVFDLDKPRKWIKDVMMEDSSESEEESIEELLRLHKKSKKYRDQYHSDPTLAKYMYYSSDALTGENKYPAHRQAVEKKCLKKKAQSNKQNRGKRSANTTSFQDGAGRGYHHQRGKSHTVSDKITHGNMVKKRALTLSRKKSMSMAALRRYLWKIIVKKEIPKAYRQHVQNQSNKFAMLKKASKDASKKVRAKAHESRLRARKEFQIARARRMTREAQLFWKKYVRVEKSQRKHAEKQALTQRRIEDEKREAYMQEQKLRFLITQTELYAQFVSGKSAEEVLKENTSIKLEQDVEDVQGINVVDSDTEDAEFSDERAFASASTAFQLHQSKLKMYSNAENLFKGKPLEDSSSADMSQPSLLCGQLTGYQLAGVNWLFNLYRHGLNGILADDMGLGKTVQTIAYFAGLAERYNVWGPFLVIAPASTLNNWHQEFSRFLPSFKVLPYWGTTSERKVLRLFWNQKSEAKADSSTPFHVLITSYQLATTDMRYFQKIPWNYIVFDEAHALKSSNSIRWRTLLDFNCRNRLLLTGTPVQNTMAELWALLHFIMPSLFDNHAEFNEWFAKNIESYADSKSSIHESDLTRLHRILKPFILRRLKCDVEHELTEKVEVRVLCQLSPRQKILYDALQKNVLVKELRRAQSFSGQSTNNIVLMNLVMQFRKVCNHPDIFHSREITSPFSMKTSTYVFPRLIYNSFLSPTSSQRKNFKLCYFDLNVNTTFNVQRSLKELSFDANFSTFSFLRLIRLSAVDYWKITTGSFSERLNIYDLESIKRRQTHYTLFWNNDNGRLFSTFPSFGFYKNGEKFFESGLPTPFLFITDLHDLCKYSSSSESLLTNLVFVVPNRTIYGHVNHIITCLTNNDSTISSLSQTENETNSPVKKNNSVSSTNRHRVVTAVRNTVLTEIAPVLSNLYAAKVVSSPRDSYCDDIGALRRFKLLNENVKKCFAGKNLVSANLIRVPDRELLVSDSGKLAALDMLLRRLKDGGHRVLIYSQMTKMIDILEEYMLMRRHSYVRLDGSCRISSRRDTVAGFQSSDEIFVFLLSTRAGGLGINLTAADTVIFYDSDWNPTVDQQAMDRAHRLGQTKQVTVYRLVCKGTVDERILARAQAKSTIQRMVIQDGGFKNDPLNQTEMVSLLLDDDHIAKASQSDDILKSSLEKAKMTGKRKYRRKANQDGKPRKKRAQSEKTEDNNNQFSTKSVNVEANMKEPNEEATNNKDLNSSGSTDDQLVVVDDDIPTPPACTTPVITRGRRRRGRPRLKPVVTGRNRLSRSPLQKRKLNFRGRGRGFRGNRRGRSFSGRAAAMAGARAGAIAASTATLQAQASSSRL